MECKGSATIYRVSVKVSHKDLTFVVLNILAKCYASIEAKILVYVAEEDRIEL